MRYVGTQAHCVYALFSIRSDFLIMGKGYVGTTAWTSLEGCVGTEN